MSSWITVTFTGGAKVIPLGFTAWFGASDPLGAVRPPLRPRRPKPSLQRMTWSSQPFPILVSYCQMLSCRKVFLNLSKQPDRWFPARSSATMVEWSWNRPHDQRHVLLAWLDYFHAKADRMFSFPRCLPPLSSHGSHWLRESGPMGMVHCLELRSN